MGTLLLVVPIVGFAFVIGTGLAMGRFGVPFRVVVTSRKPFELMEAQWRELMERPATSDTRLRDDGVRETVLWRGPDPVVSEVVGRWQRDEAGRPVFQAASRTGLASRIERMGWDHERSTIEAVPGPGEGGSRIVIDVVTRRGLWHALTILVDLPLFAWRAARRPVPTTAPEPAKALFSSPKKRTATPGPRSRGAIDDGQGQTIAMSMLAVVSFVWMFGLEYGLLLVPIVLLHEYGHLLAYRMTGGRGGRMMLVPFMGGLAIADAEHRSEFDRGFCALMGPAICVPATLLCAVGAAFLDGEVARWFAMAAVVSGLLNLFNLAPLLPLDGGHAFESLARSLAPQAATGALAFLGLGAAALLFLQDWTWAAFIVGFGGWQALNDSPPQLRALAPSGAAGLLLLYAGTVAAHMLGLWVVLGHLT